MSCDIDQVPYGAHGYGSNFTLSVMDRDYVKGLSVDEAVAIIEKCIKELHTRFLIAQTNFVIKVIVFKWIMRQIVSISSTVCWMIPQYLSFSIAMFRTLVLNHA